MLLPLLLEKGFFEMELSDKTIVNVGPIDAVMLAAKHYGYDYVESDSCDEVGRKVHSLTAFKRGVPMKASGGNVPTAAVKLIKMMESK